MDKYVLHDEFSYTKDIEVMKTKWNEAQKLGIKFDMNDAFKFACLRKPIDYVIIDYLFELLDDDECIGLTISTFQNSIFTMNTCIMELLWNRLSRIEKSKIEFGYILFIITKQNNFEIFEWFNKLCFREYYGIDFFIGKDLDLYIYNILTSKNKDMRLLKYLWEHYKSSKDKLQFSIDKYEEIIQCIIDDKDEEMREWFNLHNRDGITIDIDKLISDEYEINLDKVRFLTKSNDSKCICPVCKENENVYILSCSTKYSEHCICSMCLVRCLSGKKIKFFRCLNCMKVHMM